MIWKKDRKNFTFSIFSKQRSKCHIWDKKIKDFPQEWIVFFADFLGETLKKSLNLYILTILTVHHGVYCGTLSHNASLMKLRVQINTCSNAFMQLVLSTGPSKHMSRLSRWRRPPSSNLYLTAAPYIGIY